MKAQISIILVTMILLLATVFKAKLETKPVAKTKEVIVAQVLPPETCNYIVKIWVTDDMVDAELKLSKLQTLLGAIQGVKDVTITEVKHGDEN